MPVKPATFHQQARREQLVALAVEIIGEDGLQAASVSEIARRAGTSRGVVAYNVGDREELMDLVVARAYDVGRREVGPTVEQASGPADALRAFVSASLDFYLAHPAEMRALREIFADPDLADRAATAQYRREMHDVADLARAAGAHAPDLVAAAIRGALDHAAAAVVAGGDVEELRVALLGVVDRLVG